jgi:Protein of unknown function (DUF1552)
VSAQGKHDWSRRNFIKAIGATALALPFYRLLERSALGDGPSGPPARLVLAYSPHGRSIEFWRPGAGFAIDPNSELQVFDDATTYGVSLKNYLTVVDGLDIKVGYELLTAVGDKSAAFGHNATAMLWTGSNPRPDGSYLPQCASIDYFLAVTNQLGNATQFPLVAYSQDHSQTANAAKCYGPNGTPQTSYTKPQDLFQALFANFMNPSGNAQATADLIARKKSTLDYIQGTLTSLQSRLGPTEKAKLDQHLTAIREIENRLSTQAGGAGCMAPSAPTICDPNVATDAACVIDPSKCYCADANYNVPKYSSYSNDTMLAILTQALLCDLTRFVNIEVNDSSFPLTDVPEGFPAIPGNSQYGSTYPYENSYPPWYPAGTNTSGPPGTEQCTGGDCIHNDVAHVYRQTSNFVPSTETDMLCGQIRLARAKKYHMSKLATMAATLKGANLLDSTLIVSNSEVGDPGGHNSLFMPLIMVGNVNGYFKTGQHVIMPNDQASPGYLDKFDSTQDRYYDRQNPHNALLVMICNAFGVPVTSYGVSANPNPLLTTQGSAALQAALAAIKA